MTTQIRAPFDLVGRDERPFGGGDSAGYEETKLTVLADLDG